MYGIIFFFHILICVLLIIVVLLQQSKGTGMSSVFGGGGGADSLFGGKGATPFFIKLTTGLVVGFFVTSLTLVLLSRRPVAQSAIERGIQELPTQGVPQEGAPASPEQGPVIPQEAPPGGQ